MWQMNDISCVTKLFQAVVIEAEDEASYCSHLNVFITVFNLILCCFAVCHWCFGKFLFLMSSSAGLDHFCSCSSLKNVFIYISRALLWFSLFFCVFSFSVVIVFFVCFFCSHPLPLFNVFGGYFFLSLWYFSVCSAFTVLFFDFFFCLSVWLDVVFLWFCCRFSLLTCFIMLSCIASGHPVGLLVHPW